MDIRLPRTAIALLEGCNIIKARDGSKRLVTRNPIQGTLMRRRPIGRVLVGALGVIALTVIPSLSAFPITVLESYRLQKDLEEANDGFGYSVALSSDTVLVSAPMRDGVIQDQGKIVSFLIRPDGTISYNETLPTPPCEGIYCTIKYRRYGKTLAFVGDAVIATSDAGQSSDGTGYYLNSRKVCCGFTGFRPGAVVGAEEGGFYAVQVRSSLTGQPVAVIVEPNATADSNDSRFTGSDTASGDLFGSGLAIDGQDLFVGAPFHDYFPGDNRGAVYVFDLVDGTPPAEKNKLLPPQASRAEFGTQIALHEQILFVCDREFLHVFEKNRRWAFAQSVRFPADADGKAEYQCRNISASGDQVIVFTLNHRTGDSQAFRYVLNSGKWRYVSLLRASDNSSFGENSNGFDGRWLVASVGDSRGPMVFDLLDTDGDLLTDLEERQIGSNPSEPDSDFDGFDDFAEYLQRQSRVSVSVPFAPIYSLLTACVLGALAVSAMYRSARQSGKGLS